MIVKLWMPFWWPDYYRDTQHLSTLEHGAYLLLIGAYWVSGQPLPDDDGRLALITKLSTRAWRQMRPTMAAFFQISQGVWRHKRIDRELVEQEARTTRGKRGAAARWREEGEKPHAKAMLEPMLDRCSTACSNDAQGHAQAMLDACKTDSDSEIGVSTPIDRTSNEAGQKKRSPIVDLQKKPVGKRGRGTFLPEDFAATAELLAWACGTLRLSPGKVTLETEKFVDYWRQRSDARAVKLDWHAAWRTWLRKAAEERHDRTPAEPDLRLPFQSGRPRD